MMYIASDSMEKKQQDDIPDIRYLTSSNLPFPYRELLFIATDVYIGKSQTGATLQ